MMVLVSIILIILLVKSKCCNMISYKVTGQLFCDWAPLNNAAFLLWKDNICKNWVFTIIINVLDMVDDFIGKGITNDKGFFEAKGMSKFPRLHDIYFQIVDKCGVIEKNCYNVRRGYLKPLRTEKITNEYTWNLGNINILAENITSFKISLIKTQCYDVENE
uniref:Transthyretin-like family-containing protein n=1 Tax=Strongyloides papillosus TaxID=174720 RepID=A0A0N5B6P9_STREA